MSTLLGSPSAPARGLSDRPNAVPAGHVPGRARDPYIDGVRVVGILVVLGLHWLMVEASWTDGELVIGNALGHGSAWVLTWVQPLPLLFYAAGAAARYLWRRQESGGTGRFLTGRVRSMLPALGCFALIWAVLVMLLPQVGVPFTVVQQVALIAPQPLWFLGVQVTLTALTPVLVRADRRWGWWVPVLAGAAALIVDLLRFGAGIEQAGMANLVLVWAVPYLIGLRDAGAQLAGRRLLTTGQAGLIAVVAGVLTVVLIAAGPYPASMIGLPGDSVSNLAPPTAPMLTFAVAQVAAAVALRPRLTGRAARSALVHGVNPRSMGLYLWHLTAMFLLTGLMIFGAGMTVPQPWTVYWWATRPLVAVLAALILLALLWVDRGVRALAARTLQLYGHAHGSPACRARVGR